MTTQQPNGEHPRKAEKLASAAEPAAHRDVLCDSCRRSRSPIRLALKRIGSLLSWPLITLVRFYRLVISPLTPPTCRYYPSCSAYALTAVQRYGPLKGTLMAVRRVGRCHPWAAGGVDYVPERPHTCSCAAGASADQPGRSSQAPQIPAPQTAPPPRSASAETTAKDRR